MLSGMKQFLAALAISATFLASPAHAQQDADARYVSIYNLIQQADSLAQSGQRQEALATYTEAYQKLEKFSKIFPDWDMGIVSYRLNDVDTKIGDLKKQLAEPKVTPVNTSGPSNAVDNPVLTQYQQQFAVLQQQMAVVQAENTTLQAKLKEALATQPASVDATELSLAQKQIRELMKQNDLLKAGQATKAAAATTPETLVVTDTNKVSQLQSQLNEAQKQLATEQKRAQKLVEENTALQRNLSRSGAVSSSSVDLLKSENERLKSQLAALQSAANNAAAADELGAKLRDAKNQIAALQSAAALAALEKAALENQVRKLSSQLAESATNFDERIKDLTQQRLDLMKKLDLAAAHNATRKVADTAAQMAALNQEIATLRDRLAVDEAKAVPYTSEELALFRETQPAPVEPPKKSVKELPAGTAQLVASAQRHFSNHEFSEAEADYQKILERDENNGLALANLATIEMQEGKLDLAEKHITAAVAQSPDDAYNLSTLGFLKFRQDKYDEALDALSRAAKLDPNNPEIQNYLGVTLSHKGQRVPAETALRKSIALSPNYAPAHNNLAVIYLTQTPPMPQLARWHYQKALDAGQPHNPELEKMLADKGAPVAQ